MKKENASYVILTKKDHFINEKRKCIICYFDQKVKLLMKKENALYVILTKKENALMLFSYNLLLVVCNLHA